MKIRNGFVSNSSSSSFVITKNKNNSKIELKIDISKYITVYNTIEELKQYYIDDFCYDEEDFVDDKSWEKCVEAIKNGKQVIMFHADNESDDILSGLYYNGLSNEMFDKEDDVEIIQNGY